MNDLTPKRCGRPPSAATIATRTAAASTFDPAAELRAMGPAAMKHLRQSVEAGDPEAVQAWAALTIPRPVRTTPIPELTVPGFEVDGIMAALADGRITATEAQDLMKVLAQRDALLAMAQRYGLGSTPRAAAKDYLAGMVEGRVPPAVAREALAAIREGQEVEMAAIEQDLVAAQMAAGDGPHGEEDRE